MSKKLLYAIVMLLPHLYAIITYCQTSWTGTVDDDWSNAANWDNGVPAATVDAIVNINNAVVTIKMGTIAEAKSLTIAAKDVRFMINGNSSLTLDGSSDYGWKIESGGSFSNKIENSGYVEIANTGNSSIFNQDSFINYGTIYLYDNLRHGIENAGYFLNEIQGDIELEGADSTGFYNSGTLRNRGNLVSGFAKFGIENFDSVNNTGQIEISDVSEDGFMNQVGSHLTNEGTLMITETGEKGMINRGVVDNGALIAVDSSASIGLYNYQYFSNNEGATVLLNRNFWGIVNRNEIDNFGAISEDDLQHSIFYGINRSRDGINKKHSLDTTYKAWDVKGLVVDDRNSVTRSERSEITNSEKSQGKSISNNVAYFDNRGKINISNSEGTGILNNSRFSNLDTILIDSVDTGIVNLDTFINHAGCLEIKNYSGNMPNSFGIMNATGFIMNWGDIVIKNGFPEGIRNEGNIVNAGGLYIDSTSNGIRSQDTIHNIPSGIIEIYNSYGGFGGLINSVPECFFLNQGQFHIVRSNAAGIENNGTFFNEGCVNIDTANIGWNNFGYLHNRLSSTLKVQHVVGSTAVGIINLSNGSIANSGLIEIEDALRGFVHISGSCVNDSDGSIIIKNCTDDLTDISLGAIFDCQGILDVGN